MISIDFDGTLTEPDVEEFVRHLLTMRTPVHIVTARKDRFHATRENDNDDVFATAAAVGIDAGNIHFTNGKDKADWFDKNEGFDVHLDDDPREIAAMVESGCWTVPVRYAPESDWQDRVFNVGVIR
jgi:hypothetical protein